MLSINVDSHSISWDDEDDLRFLSRLSNAASQYARESGRQDLYEEYVRFGRETRHGVTMILQAQSGAKREGQK